MSVKALVFRMATYSQQIVCNLASPMRFGVSSLSCAAKSLLYYTTMYVPTNQGLLPKTSDREEKPDD
jgi:hypothetical protein